MGGTGSSVAPDLSAIAATALRQIDGPAPGDRVGAYRLDRVIGQGGMGAVWLAERSDGLIKRPVALKLPHGTWQKRGLAERMAREREILASLAHPHIARLYDAGVTEEGLPYLALEYVSGRPIDEHCRERALDVRARLRLFLQVVQAVAHAHARLVVHRDLKPSNILVGDDGQVRLLDFGIAGLLEGNHDDITRAVGRVLTPQYASPEQMRGEPIGVASDVFSLGVVLCELLCGARPFPDKRTASTASAMSGPPAEPKLPSSLTEDVLLRRSLRGDLDAIVAQAVRIEPDARYASVAALGEDIELHLGGFPVRARGRARSYRAARFVRRHAVGVSSIVAIGAALFAGAAVASWQAGVARAEQRRAEQVRDFVVTLFEEADPYRGEGGRVSAVQLLLDARGRIESASVAYPGLRAELLNLVGTGLIGFGETAAAEEAAADAARVARDEFGEAHPITLEAQLLVAEVNRLRGRASDARSALEPALEASRARSDAHPRLFVRGLVTLAHLEVDDGRPIEATAAAQEALGIAQVRLGSRHPLSVAAAAVLAESYLHGGVPASDVLGLVDAALKTVHDAFRDRPGHPYLVQTRHIRGRALAVAGHFHEAVDELEQAIEASTTTFGETSMLVGYHAGAVAPYQRRIGDIAGALRSSERAIRILSAHVQPDSYAHAFNLTTRGVTLLAARRAAAAEVDLATAEGILERVLGPLHWDTLTARLNRAMALAYLGRADEARALLRVVEQNPEAIANRMWTLHVVGVVERLAGDAAAAVAAQSESSELVPPGPRAPWDRVRNLVERALAFLELERIDEAERDLRLAAAEFERLGARPHPAAAEAWLALAGIELAHGAFADASMYAEKGYAFWREFDPESRIALEALAIVERCRSAVRPEASRR
jgi:serine/threonine-protein kinase